MQDTLTSRGSGCPSDDSRAEYDPYEGKPRRSTTFPNCAVRDHAVESRRDRAGELYALEITDLDFIRRQISIRRSVYDGEVQTPKTRKAYRVIDVQPWLIEMIKQHVGDRKDGLLFVNRRRQALRNTTVLRRHLHPLLKKLGIKQCGMHAFRHGRVSYLVEQGVAREIIRAWIGHGSDAMIERYLHLRASYRAAALANVKPICPMVVPSTSDDRVAAGV